MGVTVFIFHHSAPAMEDRADTSFEVIGHRIGLHIYPSQNGIECIDTFSIRLLKKDVHSIRMRFIPVYQIDQLSANGRKVDYKRERDIFWIEDVPQDSVVRYIVSYSGHLNFQSEFSSLSKDRAILREEEILPYGPRRLEYVHMNITVPSGWEVAAPGRLVGRVDQKDSTQFQFAMNAIAPMIGWICAGKFQSRRSSDGRVEAFMYDEDSSAAPALMTQAADVLDFYSQQFLPYRFETFKIVEVEDWVAGRNVLAIAVPGMVLVKKVALTSDDKYNRADAILPHEVAHQWWPMTAFIHDEDAALLAEGMCEYSALLYNEHTGKLSARDSLKHHPLLRALLLRIQKGKDLALHEKADLRSVPTHYLKSSYVHNMLRRIVGDSVFFRLYREWAQDFLGRKGSQEDFQKLAENLSGRKLDWFFDQWTTKRGVPRLKIYNVRSAQQGSSWVTRGRVRMLGYEKYTTYVDVGLDVGKEKLVKTGIWLGTDTAGAYHNDAPFEMRTETKPSRAFLDPSGDILKMQKLPMKLSDFRDPSDGLMIVGTKQHREYLRALAEGDSIRMDRNWWSLTIKYDTSITLADLQREHVFLYGKASENNIVADMQGKFPLSFHGDSIVVKGETVYDSTLALIQCIESPYVSQGSIVWIAPLSQHAFPELNPYEWSWTVVRGKEEITSGMWDVHDEDLEVEVK